MMTFEVIIGPTAKGDITRNANWWADHHSVNQAIEWVDTVELQLRELKHDPGRFGFAPENGLFTYPLHQMLIGSGNRRSYRAVFTIKADKVHILTIRRAAQDKISALDLPSSV